MPYWFEELLHGPEEPPIEPPPAPEPSPYQFSHIPRAARHDRELWKAEPIDIPVPYTDVTTGDAISWLEAMPSWIGKVSHPKIATQARSALTDLNRDWHRYEEYKTELGRKALPWHPRKEELAKELPPQFDFFEANYERIANLMPLAEKMLREVSEKLSERSPVHAHVTTEEKHAAERKIAEGRYDEVSDAYYDWVKVAHPGQKHSINVDKNLLESLSPEDRQSEIDARTARQQKLDTQTTKAEGQKTEYWNWVAGGKVGVEPNAYMLSSENKAQLEKNYQSYGYNYLEAAPDDGMARSAAVQSERADLEKKTTLYMFYEPFSKYVDSGTDAPYLQWYQENHPDRYKEFTPDFIAEVKQEMLREAEEWEATSRSIESHILRGLSEQVPSPYPLRHWPWEGKELEIRDPTWWEKFQINYAPLTTTMKVLSAAAPVIEAIDKPWALEASYQMLKGKRRSIMSPEELKFYEIYVQEKGPPNLAADILETSVGPISSVVHAIKNIKHSPELEEAYQDLATWQKVVAEASNPVWWISLGGAGSAVANALRATRLTSLAAKVQKAAVIATKIEVAPAKPIEAVLKKFGAIRETRRLVTAYNAADDITKATVRGVRQRQIAGEILTPDEQALVDVFKNRWGKVLGEVKPTKAAEVTAKAEPPSELAKVTQMWEKEITATQVTMTERATSARLVMEEQLLDKFAGFNKAAAGQRKLYKQRYGVDMPPEIDAEVQAALVSGAPQAGLRNFQLAMKDVRNALGKGVSINEVNSYLHLRHFMDVVKQKGDQRLIAGGVEGLEGATKALNELSVRLGPEKFARVEAAATLARDFYTNLLDRKVAEGLVAEKVAKALKAKYPWYNTTKYLEFLGKEGYGRNILSVTGNDLRRLSDIGLDSMREAPLATMARVSVQSELLMQRNRAAKAVIGLAEYDEQLAKLIGVGKVVTHSGEIKGTLSVMREGKRVVYEVPEWIEREAKYLTSLPQSAVETIGRSILQVSRAGMTTYNPAFFIPNMMFDTLAAMMTGNVLPHNIAVAFGRNIKNLIKGGDPIIDLYITGKGGMGGFWGRTPEQIIKAVNKEGNLAIRSALDWKGVLKKPFETVADIGLCFEMSPRIAVFSKQLKGGAPLERAVLAGRRASIDFARSGAAIKWANSFFLYLNAGVQGSILPFRALRDNPRSRLFLTGLMGFSAASYAWNRQFPEYEDVPDFAKYGSFPFMLPSNEYSEHGTTVPHYITIIPNLREFALFHGLLTYALRKLDNKDPGSMDYFLNTLFPIVNPVSQVIGTSAGQPLGFPTPIGQTFYDISTNWDGFRNRPIVPEYLEASPPEEQYNQWTSRTARKIGALFNMSPMNVDYFVSGVFGGVGNIFMDIADSVLNKVSPVPVDAHMEALLAQLKQISETVTPTKIPLARTDFLQSLPREDKEKLLQLEKAPTDRIPLITTIMNRLYRTYGGQVYRTAVSRAKEAITTQPFEDNQEELNRKMEDLATDFLSGNITGYEMSEIASNHRIFYAGGKAEAWAQYTLYGGIAGIDAQQFLPEEYRWPIEIKALNEYQQKQAELIEAAGGTLTDEKLGEIFNDMDKWLAVFPRDVQDYVKEHRYDWVNDLDEKARLIFGGRYEDLEKVSESGYWDRPSGTRSEFLSNPANAEIEAILVFWGLRREASTPEAEQQVADLIRKYGATVDSVYGDDIDRSYKQFDFGMPTENVYAYVRAYDNQEDSDSRKIYLETSHKADAILCFMGKKASNNGFPETEAGWAALEDNLKRNGLTWEDVYGIKIAKQLDTAMKFSLLEPSADRSAFRYCDRDWDAVGVEKWGWTPVDKWSKSYRRSAIKTAQSNSWL